MQNKSIFFASDFHLGLHTLASPRQREQRIVDWLHYIKPHAEELFLLGDVFDFWFEYKYVVPKGFVRFLATLAEFTDSGIPVHILTGNHDVWLFDYLPKEVGVNILHGPIEITRHGRRLYLCHGDEVGRRPLPYRAMRTLFHSFAMQRLFAWLIHPDIAHAFGSGWSHRSRKVKPIAHAFRGKNEPLVQFFSRLNKTDKHDVYLAGHLHTPVLHLMPDGTPIVILGDWISAYTYAQWNGAVLSLMQFHQGDSPIALSEVKLTAID